MSSTRQAVILWDILVDFGNLPDFTPDHQVLLETGISGGIGGFAFGSPMIDFRRKNPVSGRCDSNILLSIFLSPIFMATRIVSIAFNCFFWGGGCFDEFFWGF